MTRSRRAVLLLVGLFLAANLAYAAKSMAGINLDPFGDLRHHGSWFPFGDWLLRRVNARP